MIRKSPFIFILSGIFFIYFSALADRLGIGNKGEVIGASQILGIEIGIILILTGIGFLTVRSRENFSLGETIKYVAQKIINLPTFFWVAATFLVLYLIFFISPMFFSEIRIQYFTKYIPDAWETRIGFDIETTVNHINDWIVHRKSPYIDGIVPYTPFTLAIFIPFLIIGYPSYYKLLTLATIFSYSLAFFFIPLLISEKKKLEIPVLLGVMGLFSYGFQSELQKGQFNVIAIAMSLFAIYIFHYHHAHRYFAYLLFSFSIQLKLYPAIFIVMFVRDWSDWKIYFRRVIGLGIFNLSLLFVLGYQIFIEFSEQIIERQTNFQSSRYEDMSISGFKYYLAENDFGIFSKYPDTIGSLILFFLVIIILIIMANSFKNRDKRLNPYLFLACTIGAMIIPTASFDYKLSILVAPMIIFLNSLPTGSNTYKKILTIPIVVSMTAAYWLTLYPYSVKIPVFFRNSPALLIIFIATALLFFIHNGNFKNVNEICD